MLSHTEFASNLQTPGVIQLKSPSGQVFGQVSTMFTGGWQSWTEISHEVILPVGTRSLVISAPTGGYNLNWFKIQANPVKEPVQKHFLNDRISHMQDFLDNHSEPNANMIINGDFENGSLGWESYVHPGISSSVRLGGNFNNAVGTMFDGGSKVWHVQAYQTGLTLEQGKTYRVSFDHTTSGKINSGVFDIAIEESGDDYTKYREVQQIQSNLLNNHVAFEFTMNRATDNNARITFNMGNNHSPGGGFPININIDNVTLVEVQ